MKYSAHQSLEKEYPTQRFSFSFFQNNVWVEDKAAYLTTTMINTKPTDGCWQSIGAIPTDNKKTVVLEFTYGLKLNKEQDEGKVLITIGKKHQKWKKKISKESKLKVWGIYNADSQTCLKFKDTAPTW